MKERIIYHNEISAQKNLMAASLGPLKSEVLWDWVLETYLLKALGGEVVVRKDIRKQKEGTDKVMFSKYGVQKNCILLQMFSTYAKPCICKLLTGIAWLDWVIAHVGKKP